MKISIQSAVLVACLLSCGVSDASLVPVERTETGSTDSVSTSSPPTVLNFDHGLCGVTKEGMASLLLDSDELYRHMKKLNQTKGRKGLLEFDDKKQYQTFLTLLHERRESLLNSKEEMESDTNTIDTSEMQTMISIAISIIDQFLKRCGRDGAGCMKLNDTTARKVDPQTGFERGMAGKSEEEMKMLIESEDSSSDAFYEYLLHMSKTEGRTGMVEFDSEEQHQLFMKYLNGTHEALLKRQQLALNNKAERTGEYLAITEERNKLICDLESINPLGKKERICAIKQEQERETEEHKTFIAELHRIKTRINSASRFIAKCQSSAGCKRIGPRFPILTRLGVI